ncbi:glycerophosphodiester phosphodiesterase family protein [Thalassobacillus devorans]|uniref:glycerophosphodiester phosphodiesterase family protein n=1 Tax=Thalassobacillus devorans TaxID=279813 RepID=UPI000A1CD05F|nr:glycerophosphodiester phosphodiesterase family protein [Thalassobacillus devorans]
MKKKKALTIAIAVFMLFSAAQPAFAKSERSHKESFGPKTFDLQAHRGGMGLNVESSIASFSHALEMGISTLELDVQITEDHQAVVTHDRKISKRTCRDTSPAFPGDPEFPYVGKYIKDLTLAQIRTMDCGTMTKDEYPEQQPSPGAKMLLLSEVFDLVKRYKAKKVWMNIETKVEAGAPWETAPHEAFVQVVSQEVREAGMLNRVSIQSFDWGALMRMKEVEPRLPIIALTNGPQFLRPGQPGASPWLGGIDIDDFDGDLVAAAQSFGADAISPVHGFPQDGKINDDNYVPYVTEEMVDAAHKAGMKVIPWTVDDKATMNKLIDNGVDGIITNYPDRLREVMKERKFKLPKDYQVTKK